MKACVLGCGVSGRGALRLLKEKGYEAVGIDRAVKDIEGFQVFSEDEIDLLKFDLMVTSPGISLNHFLIREALKNGLEVLGEIELGLRYLSSYCIAISGTNGKTTTSALITHILNENGKKAVALGNSGVSLCEGILSLQKETIVVLELSSYQIEWIKSKKIDQAFIINIEEDHLDHYDSFLSYASAKLLLLDCVKECCWIRKNILESFNLLLKKSAIFFDNEQIVATLKELGYTNSEVIECENLFAAWQMTKSLVSKEGFCKGVCSFQGLEHRLEKFVKINDVVIYNDSKSTNPASVIYALKKIPNQVVLMLGGEDKGLSFTKILEDKAKIAHLICFGKAKEKIANQLLTLNPTLVSTVEEAALLSLKIAGENTAIVFSPGCSSYDAFKNYAERGTFFKKTILGYLQEKKL